MSTNTFVNYIQKTNGNDVDATWWNQLALAGINLEGWLGLTGFAAETVFTIVNNEATPNGIGGLNFDGTKIRSFEIDYHIYRNTTGSGASEAAERGTLYGVFSTVAGTWEMTQFNVGNSGVLFSILANGQMEYTSTNMTGTPASSVMHYTYRTMGI